MKILAVEFSSSRRSVAIENVSVANKSTIFVEAIDSGGRSALGLVENALKQAGCEREDIDIVAVGLGPGSYTGIRGAIALAQGWQLGREIKTIGISSAECLAETARGQYGTGQGYIVIDAQRGEYYVAKYAFSSEAVHEIEPLRLAAGAEIAELVARGERVLGPDLEGAGFAVESIHPHASKLLRLAAKRTDFLPAERLEPIYMRETSFKKAPPPRKID